MSCERTATGSGVARERPGPVQDSGVPGVPPPRQWAGQLAGTRIAVCLHLAILLVPTLLLFRLNIALGGSVASPARLAEEFKAPPDSPQDWTLKRSPPTRYRVLFRWLVTGTWKVAFPKGGAREFHRTYVCWSILCWYGTIVGLYRLLRNVRLRARTSLLGCLLFFGLPPVTLAYLYPAHTREDPLVYLLVVLAVAEVLRSRRWAVSALTTAGVLARETALVALVAYWWGSRDSLARKLLVIMPPIVAAVGIRLLLGYESYDPFAASVRNAQFLPETGFFLFLVFGVLWVPGLAMMRRARLARGERDTLLRPLASSAVPALVVVVGTHLLFARAREVRISFLLFPWMIPMALAWLQSSSSRVRSMLRRRSYWIIVALGILLSGVGLTLLRVHVPAYVDYPWAFPWVVMAVVHLLATLSVVLPGWVGRRVERVGPSLGR
jgi:hypothetical protein